jgi:biliverdin reductase
MSDIKLGIIGSGGMARSHAAAFHQLDGIRIHAIAARNKETGPPLAEEFGAAFFPDWESLISQADLEAVAICTNNDSHGQIAIGAIEAGKHVFAEYPLARTIDEANLVVDLARSAQTVFRMTHRGFPAEIQRAASELGSLMDAIFVRLTPGRGSRPEKLLNLNVSGPPALFFVNHLFPIVELCGPAAWVNASSDYIDQTEDGGYLRFANSVAAGFSRGGLAQWTWAGGIEVEAAEEYQRLIFERGTLARLESGWVLSAKESARPITIGPDQRPSLQETFIGDIQGDSEDWRNELDKAFDAVRISLAAEQSMLEGKRIPLE